MYVRMSIKYDCLGLNPEQVSKIMVSFYDLRTTRNILGILRLQTETDEEAEVIENAMRVVDKKIDLFRLGKNECSSCRYGKKDEADFEFQEGLEWYCQLNVTWCSGSGYGNCSDHRYRR